ncbi:unnamed protein product [Chilo suppressalis]|uniref:Regulatory protein zeste n=1 Tax=Chilo suppressalis TaxID=168631 RepID=A0ABN8LAQ4_CHISP|nr:unnamed protein product [Chilo suppressalis]
MSKQKINGAQKQKLLDLLASKPQLRAGKFKENFTHKDAQREWEDISRTLNSIPGANKDWKAWRKTWQDILSKTKSKTAAINRVRRGTGGGPPPTEPLDEFEEGVAAFLHQHAISGHTESTESVVTFEDEPIIYNYDIQTIEPVPSTSEQQDCSSIHDTIILPPSGYEDCAPDVVLQAPPPTQANRITNSMY